MFNNLKHFCSARCRFDEADRIDFKGILQKAGGNDRDRLKKSRQNWRSRGQDILTLVFSVGQIPETLDLTLPIMQLNSVFC